MWGDRGVVVQSRPTLCDPVDYSTPGFPVLHYLPEFAQTHVRWASWWHPAISSPTPFSSCLQSFPAAGCFPVSWFFTNFFGYYFIIDIWIKMSRVYLKLTNVICQLRLTKARKKEKQISHLSLVQHWGRNDLTSEVKVTQSCLTLCDCIGHGILQARILKWVAFPFSRGPSQPRDRTQVSRITGRLFTSWAIREAQEYCSG